MEQLTSAALVRGGRYNWTGQPERLEYLGKKGSWHQFAKVGRIGEVWCEVQGSDLYMLEETTAPRGLLAFLRAADALASLLAWPPFLPISLAVTISLSGC